MLSPLSPGEIEKIRADMRGWKRTRDVGADAGIRRLVEAGGQKQKLASGKNPK